MRGILIHLVTMFVGCGADTPSSEPGVSFTDMYDSDFEDDEDAEQPFRQVMY